MRDHANPQVHQPRIVKLVDEDQQIGEHLEPPLRIGDFLCGVVEAQGDLAKTGFGEALGVLGLGVLVADDGGPGPRHFGEIDGPDQSPDRVGDVRVDDFEVLRGQDTLLDDLLDPAAVHLGH